VTGLCCLAVSPDGQRVAGGTRGGDVLLWDAKSPRLRGRTARPGASVAGLAFSPEGNLLAVALLPAAQGTRVEDGSIGLYDTEGLESRGNLPGHTGGTRCVTYASDGRLLASGGEDGTVKLWEAASGRERVCLEWHLDAVCAVTFAPDALTLASGSFDGTAKLWPREVLRPLERQREPSALAT
jgi:WD40 repeat protein